MLLNNPSRKTIDSTSGESILEILLAVAIFSTIIPSVLYVVGSTADRQGKVNWPLHAHFRAEEIKKVIKQKKSIDWDSFSEDATHLAVKTEAGWEFERVDTKPTPMVSDDLITTIISSSARRDSSGTLTRNESGYIDPATRKLTITVDWYGCTYPITQDFYITRTDNLRHFLFESEDNYLQGAVIDGASVLGSESDNLRIGLNGESPKSVSGVVSHWDMNGDDKALQVEMDVAEGGSDNLFFKGAPQFENAVWGKGVGTKVIGTSLYASPSARIDLTGQGAIIVALRTSGDITEEETVLEKFDESKGYKITVSSGGLVRAEMGGGISTISSSTTKSILDNLWHIIAFSYDGQSLMTYFDGTQDGLPVVGSSQLYPSTSSLFVGNSGGTGLTPYGGIIDNVQLYANSLSAKEIENAIYSTYTSPVVDLGSKSLIHNLIAIANKPQGSKIRFQVHVANKSDGACPYGLGFVGPSGQSDVYYEVSPGGEVPVSFAFPIGEFASGKYQNPGSCVAFRVQLYTNSDSDELQESPYIKNVKFLYSL